MKTYLSVIYSSYKSETGIWGSLHQKKECGKTSAYVHALLSACGTCQCAMIRCCPLDIVRKLGVLAWDQQLLVRTVHSTCCSD